MSSLDTFLDDCRAIVKGHCTFTRREGEKLLAEITRLRALVWQPFSEAPKDGTRILGWWSKRKIEIVRHCTGAWWYAATGHRILNKRILNKLPTLYLPLPEPSEEEKAAADK